MLFYFAQSIEDMGFCRILVNLLTKIPVKKAEIIVPSLVPTTVKSKNISDSITESATQKISKAIFTLPKFFFAVSATAFTKASPEFIITFAITAREMPKPKIATPITTKPKRIK